MSAEVLQLHESPRVLELAQGAVRVLEGAARVSSGRVELCMLDARGRLHVVATRGPGSWLLEAAAGSGFRIRAREPSRIVLESEPSPESTRALALALTRELSERSREAERRRLAGHFVIALLLLVCLYTVVLWALLRDPSGLPANSALVSVPLQALFLAVMAHFIWRSGLEWSAFGFTLEGARPALRSAASLTISIAALAVLAKLVALRLGLLGSGREVLEPGRLLHAWGARKVLGFALTYLVFSGVQEAVVRGGVQTGFGWVFEGRRAEAWAIALSNLVFALMHLHLSPAISVATFVVGCAWGVLYAKRRTLVGVYASHALLGTFAFFVLGFGT